MCVCVYVCSIRVPRTRIHVCVCVCVCVCVSMCERALDGNLIYALHRHSPLSYCVTVVDGNGLGVLGLVRGCMWVHVGACRWQRMPHVYFASTQHIV